MLLTYWKYKVFCIQGAAFGFWWHILCSHPVTMTNSSRSSHCLPPRKPPSAGSSPWKRRQWPPCRLLSTSPPWPQTWDPSPIIAQILSSMGKLTFGAIYFCGLLSNKEVFVYIGKRWKAGELRMWLEGGCRGNSKEEHRKSFIFIKSSDSKISDRTWNKP